MLITLSLTCAESGSNPIARFDPIGLCGPDCLIAATGSIVRLYCRSVKNFDWYMIRKHYIHIPDDVDSGTDRARGSSYGARPSKG